AHRQPVLVPLLEPAPRDRVRGGDTQVGSDRPAEASTPLREYRDHHRRRTLGPLSEVLCHHHEGLPHTVGVAADHEADAALAGPEPGLESEGSRAVRGGRPPGKTGLDKHGAGSGGRVGAKGCGLLPTIRKVVVMLMGDGAPVGGALKAPETLPWRERDPVQRVGGPEPIPVPDMIPTKPLPIGVLEIHPSVSSWGIPCQDATAYASRPGRLSRWRGHPKYQTPRRC